MKDSTRTRGLSTDVHNNINIFWSKAQTNILNTPQVSLFVTFHDAIWRLCKDWRVNCYIPVAWYSMILGNCKHLKRAAVTSPPPNVLPEAPHWLTARSPSLTGVAALSLMGLSAVAEPPQRMTQHWASPSTSTCGHWPPRRRTRALCFVFKDIHNVNIKMLTAPYAIIMSDTREWIV